MIKEIVNLRYHLGFMKYLKNTSWLFAEKVLRVFTGLIVGIWLSRYLGPNQLGVFSYAQSFVVLLTCMASLGIDSIVIRELVKSKNRNNDLILTSFLIKLFGAIFSIFLLVIGIIFSSNDSFTNTLIIIIGGATIFQVSSVFDLYFQSKVLSKYSVFGNIISLVISTLIKITLIIYDAPLIAFAYLMLFDGFTLSVGLVYFFKQQTKFKIKNAKFSKEIALKLLKDSWPLALSTVAIVVYVKIDQIMIMHLLGNESVGNYAAAVRISEAWGIIPTIIMSSFFPAIINAKQKCEQTFIRRLKKLYAFMFLSAVCIAIPISLFSTKIILLLYGDMFSSASAVLSVHIWANIFVFLGLVSGRWFIAENLQIYSLINAVLGALLNIVLNFLFINSMGLIGAALATLISYSFIAYFSLFIWKKTRSNFFAISLSLFTLKILK